VCGHALIFFKESIGYLAILTGLFMVSTAGEGHSAW